MKLNFSAGRFEVVAYTDGHPMWTTIKHRGEGIAQGIHHGELKDLQFVIERLRAAMRPELGKDGHELD